MRSRVCQALYSAQKQYAATSHDGVPAGTYAQRFRSEPGTQNGLYWEVKEGEPQSPAGSLVAEATSEGYDSAKQSGKPTPFHGYLYRILKAQGPNAPGGAKDYVSDGRMTGGFAFVAYPAEYRSSGVMTFLVGPRGVVYQKDLGETTEETCQGHRGFRSGQHMGNGALTGDAVRRVPLMVIAATSCMALPVFK